MQYRVHNARVLNDSLYGEFYGYISLCPSKEINIHTVLDRMIEKSIPQANTIDPANSRLLAYAPSAFGGSYPYYIEVGARRARVIYLHPVEPEIKLKAEGPEYWSNGPTVGITTGTTVPITFTLPNNWFIYPGTLRNH
jgi:hypothetical protein